MPIPETYMYITTTYMGYLSAIKQHGPIVHPAKVKKEEAIALMMAGAPIIVHDPATKMTYPLTMDTMNKTVKEATYKIPEPIKVTKLEGAPKGVGDFGISKQHQDAEPKVVPDLNKVIAEQETAKQIVEEFTVVSENTEEIHEETKMTANEVIEKINLHEITESDIKWSDYTKSERRQIRAALNSLTQETAE